jgi:hypothetical protein
MRRWLACFVQLLLVSSLSFSQDVSKPALHVSGTVPVDSSRIQLSAERPNAQPGTIAQPRIAVPGNTWQLLATLPGVIIHDIAFPPRRSAMP